MGGALSEPGTLVDLGLDVMELHKTAEKLRDVGWDFGDFSAQQMVAGVTHVDDSVAFSRLICHKCIFSGMTRLWPDDVDVELEETGPILSFLSTVIHITDGDVNVFPWSPNVCFSLRLTGHQHIARLGPFIDEHLSCRERLHMFVLSRYISAHYIVNGSREHMFLHIAIIAREVLILGWPQKWLAGIMRSIPARYNSPFCHFIRHLGQRLRRQDWRCVFRLEQLLIPVPALRWMCSHTW